MRRRQEHVSEHRQDVVLIRRAPHALSLWFRCPVAMETRHRLPGALMEVIAPREGRRRCPQVYTRPALGPPLHGRGN